MDNKKEELKNVKIEEIKEENVNDSNEQLAPKPRLLAGFKIESTVTQTGKTFSKLIITTLMGKETSIFLSDTQLDIINLVGQDNCYVDIESRYSSEKRKNYNVIVLHCADEILEFFVKDRAFITLALLHAKKVLGKDYPF